MPYNVDALPVCCRASQIVWTVRVPLLFFYAVEWHYPDRVLRQFGGYQDIPMYVEYDYNLHKLDGRTRNENWDVFHQAYVALWEDRGQYVVPFGPHAPLGPYVEALRHINIHGEIAVEHGQNNSFTNVMQQIARDELVRLNYGYVLELPRNNEEFMYEPIHQVRVVDRRRDGSRRGRSAQGGRRQVISPPFNLNDELPIEAYDDPHNAPLPTQDDLDRDNKMGDISQQDVIQQVMTPYDNQLHMYWEGSSSQVPPHAQHPIRTPSNHMTNDPFPHPIQNYITDEDSTINTSQVVNPTQPQGARGDIIYQRRRPVRNRRPPPCGTE
nr:Serine/threonine-protein phosphatase 7 long form-like [Ipomoea batatas]